MVRFIVLHCANLTSSIDLVVKIIEMCSFRYCLRLYAKSSAAYNSLKEVLILPSHSTLCRERNKAGAVQPGVLCDLLN